MMSSLCVSVKDVLKWQKTLFYWPVACQRIIFVISCAYKRWARVSLTRSGLILYSANFSLCAGVSLKLVFHLLIGMFFFVFV